MTQRGDEPPRPAPLPALEEPTDRVGSRSARLPALLVIIALVGVAGAGFLGRAGSPPPGAAPAPPVAGVFSAPPAIEPTVAPSPPPSVSRPPPSHGPSSAPVDPARFWLVVLRDGGRRLERADLTAVPTGLEASIVVRPGWQLGRVRIRLFGRHVDGQTLRLADVPLPSIPGLALELPVDLASGTVALGERIRWDHRITLEGGAAQPLRLVAHVTLASRITR